MKSKRKVLMITGILVIAAAAAIYFIPKPALSVSAVGKDTLKKMSLKTTVSTTGMVESMDAANVYAKQNGIVKTVNVKVGDKVKSGDILCLFDTETLELQIAQQEAALNSAAAQAGQQIYISEKKYENAVSDFESDMDSGLLNAKNSVTNAQYALKDSQYALDHFGDGAESTGSTSDLYHYTQALKDRQEAQKNLDAAQETLKAAKASGNQAQTESAQTAVNVCRETLRQAEERFKNAQDSFPDVDHQYSQLQDGAAKAQTAYDSAMTQYEILWNSTLEALDSYSDNVNTAKLSADTRASRIAIQQLKKQLDDCTVSAPVSGTVTAVYAKEGAGSTGLLFVIEDTERLKISATVTEYDLASVKTGMKAEIKSDATGDTIIEGTVSQIAPTAVKAPDGTAKTGAAAEFETEIQVTGPHDGLRIGMNTRINILLDQKEDVFGVPFDSVVTDENGSYLFTVTTNEKGQSVAKKVPVTTGLESDFYLEVSGEGLSEGMVIITTPAGLMDGSPVPAS